MSSSHAPDGKRAGATRKAPAAVCAERLFGAEQELRIHYLGQEYRLRKTRNGKLILTK